MIALLLLPCLPLLTTGCITDDIASIIDIFDPEHGGSPDLVIEEIACVPSEPEAGDTVKVSVTISNSGRTRSAETACSLVAGDDEISTTTIPRLAGGARKTIEFPVELALPAGITVLQAVADPGRAGAESKWHNNVLGTTIIVGEPVLERSFEWNYEGLEWEIAIRIPADDLQGLKTDRSIYSYEGYLEYVKTGDRTVGALAEILHFYADYMGYGTYDEVSFVLAFVQEMPYTSDTESRGDNYPRYPIETIADGGGDCEDTSTLFVSILSNHESFNYGTCLLIVDEHMAAGVAGSEGIGGHYFQVGGRSYYYCETTGKGYAIGEVPEAYEGAEIKDLVEVY